MAHNTIIRLPAVLARTGLSRSTVYAAMGRDEFPAPLSLGARSVGWLESDIDTWLQTRIRLTRGPSRSST